MRIPFRILFWAALTIFLLSVAACNGEGSRAEDDINATTGVGQLTGETPSTPGRSVSPTPGANSGIVATPTALAALAPAAEVKPPTLPAQQSPTATATGVPEDAPRFQDTSCSEFGFQDGPEFRCGYFSVPEGRQKSDSDTIRLAVMVARATGKEVKPDPVVYLAGGPGENAIESMQFLFPRHFVAFTEDRDLVVVDQRGTGLSEPALDCPELLALRDETAGLRLDNDESLAMASEAITGCRNRLAGLGVDLGSYTSVASAADVHELMKELGYEQWNVYGVSYGTRLALTIMRDYPSGVRSAILDSAYPLQADLYASAPANLDRALNTLFERCGTSQACDASYPELEKVLLQAASALDAEPAQLEISNPLTGQNIKPLFDGDDLLGFIFLSLYDSDIIPSLPRIIYDVRDGRFGTVELILGSRLIADQLVSLGMHLSVQCGEEVPFTSAREIRAGTSEFPNLSDMFEGMPTFGPAVVDNCGIWDVPPAGLAANEPVISDIPTLITAGTFDPITPPSWGKMLDDELARSLFIEFPSYGHGSSINNTCAIDLIKQFLENPEASPNESCLADLTGPVFEVPASDINLVPVSDVEYGYSALAPVGWEIIGPGMYGQTALGETALVMQSLPSLGESGFLDLLKEQLNLSETPPSRGKFEGSAVTWSLYSMTVQELSVDVALAESGINTYVVILQTKPDQREYLLRELFEPVLEAFTPDS